VLLGILSDTHDRVDMTAAAISALARLGVERYFHCGDVGGAGVLDCFGGLPLTFVWGNNDYPRDSLARYAADLNLECCGDLADVTIGAKHIAMLHGDDDRLLANLIDQQQHDYVFHGHTHVARDQRIGRCRIINPGALQRANIKTVATLDTKTDALRMIRIDPSRR
jgi:uncharacterized protein